VVWPTERRDLFQRYTDAPAAELLVPTLPAFAASKTATWADRHAPRDPWDLWALSGHGAIDAEAAGLFRRYGPTNKNPAPHMFTSASLGRGNAQAGLAGQLPCHSASDGSKQYARPGGGHRDLQEPS
jgi:hypothetical protein